MAEILTAGYQSLRDYVQANWKYIELRDGSGNALIRIGIGDSRVTWTHNAGDQTLKLQIIITGANTEFASSLPKTFASSHIYSVSSGGSSYSDESFTAFTMEASGDQLTVIHELEIPQVV